jgi:hypothetical protein
VRADKTSNSTNPGGEPESQLPVSRFPRQAGRIGLASKLGRAVLVKSAGGVVVHFFAPVWW